MTSDKPTLEERLRAAIGSQYSIDRELGGGGMARVFLATETRLARRVVVKILPPDTAARVSFDRFQREIMLAAGLQNPHIVPVLTAGDADGLPFFTMPFVEGESLRSKLSRHDPMTQREQFKILRDVASALAYAHERSIIHRDIKPDNVLISGDSAMVTDFGVAKALSSATPNEESQDLTETGSSLGTPAYMAPEQIAGDNVDARTDIYAWGVLAYELLTGQHPFADRKTPQAMIAAHVTGKPVNISKRNPDLPPGISEIVMRSLEKDRDRRPASAGVLAAAFDANPVRAALFSNRRTVYAVAGAVVAVLLLASFLVAKRNSSPRIGSSGGPINSIAVLPFTDLSPKRDQDYFAEGIAEELTTVLSKVEGLRVAGRTSAFAFKGKEAQSAEIGEKLNVGGILEGSIRKSGDQLRVTAQLVDAKNGYAIWSDRYDRKESDVFAVEDELAASIANALKLKLSFAGANNPAVSRTHDVAAYNLYLQGRYFWNRRTGATAQKAISFLEQALARDSSFALAHSALAEAYVTLPAYANVDPLQSFNKAKAEAERALALDSTLAGAHAALGSYFVYVPHDSEAAAREYRRSIALNADYATARHWYGLFYFDVLGNADSAVAELARAQTIDPLSLIINTQYAQSLYLARRFPQAIAQGLHTIELDSTFVRGHRDLALTYIAAHRFADAEREFRETLRIVGDPPGREMAYLYAVTGRQNEARALISSVAATERSGKEGRRYGIEYSPPVEIALVYAALGDKGAAFEWLDRARAAHMFLGFPRLDPRYDPLRTDPRFASLLQ
ncbi:MAG: protein kinase [Gemmatimonadaceae bacterium]